MKKIIEIEAVKRFISNSQIIFDESKLNVEPTEPSDIDYQGLSYQVVYADFEFQKLMGMTPKDANGVKFIEGRVRNPGGIWKDFVLDPLRKKGKYGKSAQGTILLVNSHSEPPWLEEQIQLAKTLNSNMREIQKLYFDKIYIVCPNKNLQLFP